MSPEEQALHEHVKSFQDRRWHPKYLLSVDTANASTGIKLRDPDTALMVCATAELSGLCEYLRLSYFPDRDTEKVLFASGSKSKTRVTSKRMEYWLERKRRWRTAMTAK